MTEKKRTYICIDLKSFYASAECVFRKLDPLKTNLVVADPSRTEKTICLAVSPSLKSYGIKGRARLFEVMSKVKEINEERKRLAPGHHFIGSSIDDDILKKNPELSLDYIIAPPQMKKYIEVSSNIYSIYLKYIAKEDIHVYSIDEVFMDVTCYLKTYHKTAEELTTLLIQEVLKSTGITATGGIGSNLYLAKVAMDIQAKHIKPDKDGVRIASLDEEEYKEKLWNHTPLTDFWRIGKGYEQRLNALGIFTMGDIARCAFGKEEDFYNEDLLYDEFGVNAELLLDHAFGIEPVTIKDIKAYKPEKNSLSVGQVLHSPYTYKQTELILNEMAEEIALELVSKKLVTEEIVLNIIFDKENLSQNKYCLELKKDYLGRPLPKPYHGSKRFKTSTSSTIEIKEAILSIFKEMPNKALLIRKINIAAINVKSFDYLSNIESNRQLSLFNNYEEEKRKEEEKKNILNKEKRIQETLLSIKEKYGKNSILKMNDLEKEATAKERNNQIGGHKA